jgi:hypothetical protein
MELHTYPLETKNQKLFWGQKYLKKQLIAINLEINKSMGSKIYFFCHIMGI